MRRTKKSGVGHLVRDGRTLWAFVPTDQNWIRTHWCVLVFGCPQCRTRAGEPCCAFRGNEKQYVSETHYMRRDAAKGRKPTTVLSGITIPLKVKRRKKSMTKKMLKKASESAAAAQLRAAMGVGPSEPVEVRTPQFERPAGELAPKEAPSTAAGFDALRAMSDTERYGIGMRAWGRPEEDDLSSEISRRGARRPAGLNEHSTLWLFPGEWYNHIPDGYEVVDINFYVEPFVRGKTDNDIRYGCLSCGIVVQDGVHA